MGVHTMNETVGAEMVENDVEITKISSTWTIKKEYNGELIEITVELYTDGTITIKPFDGSDDEKFFEFENSDIGLVRAVAGAISEATFLAEIEIKKDTGQVKE